MTRFEQPAPVRRAHPAPARLLLGRRQRTAARRPDATFEGKLRIDDPRIAALRLGGRFTSADPQDFLDALAASFDVVSYRRDDLIVIGPAKNRTVQ